MVSEPRPKLHMQNTRKGGYHGEAWEQTERMSEDRQGQGSGDHREDQHAKSQGTQQPSDGAETEKKEEEAGEGLEEVKDKETGYDDPDRDADENGSGK